MFSLAENTGVTERSSVSEARKQITSRDTDYVTVMAPTTVEQPQLIEVKPIVSNNQRNDLSVLEVHQMTPHPST